MSFHVGDTVIHCSFGLGKITQIEKRMINDHLTNCYVVQITDMTVWVPVDDKQHNCLRLPTPPEEFSKVLPILSSPNEALQEDRLERRKHLMEQLSDGRLISICYLIRDLTHFKRSSKLSDQEKSILERATKTLLAEWSLSLGVSQNQAYQAMENLLLN